METKSTLTGEALLQAIARKIYCKTLFKSDEEREPYISKWIGYFMDGLAEKGKKIEDYEWALNATLAAFEMKENEIPELNPEEPTTFSQK